MYPLALLLPAGILQTFSGVSSLSSSFLPSPPPWSSLPSPHLLWADNYSNKNAPQPTNYLFDSEAGAAAVVVVYRAVLLFLGCISLHHYCSSVTWWPYVDPQPCSHWWSSELAGKAESQLCSCAKTVGQRRGCLQLSFIYIHPLVLFQPPFPSISCCLHVVYNFGFCNDITLVCRIT